MLEFLINVQYIADKNARPKLPQFIYMSIHEIEQRLFEEGIYRINGSKEEMSRLKEQFLHGTVRHQDLKGEEHQKISLRAIVGCNHRGKRTNDNVLMIQKNRMHEFD